MYVAIGSAAHMARQGGDALWSIEPQYEQQFPRFLRTLKTECPCDPVHIILIDPMLEDPPFLVCNNKKELASNWSKVAENIYYEDICNVTVYALRQNVEYEGGIRRIEGILDITECLRLLNTLAVTYRWFVVVQDYSGNDIAGVGLLFSQEVAGHLDHIIYGLNVQYDGGCYLDISQPNCDFVYAIDDLQIKAIVTHDMESIKALESAGDKRHIILRDQRYTYLRGKREIIIGILASLRAIYKDGAYTYMLHNIIRYRYKDILQDIETMSSSSQFETVGHILRLELNTVFDTQVVEDIMHKIHVTKDPYKWIDIVSEKFTIIHPLP